MNPIGILCAVIALFGWGFGDFLIQKLVRKLDIWKVMFYIAVTALIGLGPFVYKELLNYNFWSVDTLILIGVGIVSIFAFTFDSEALKDGKISVIEPIIGMEVPFAVGLSIMLAKERLDINQLLLIAAIFIGSILTITIHHTQLHYHKRIIEKGVIFAFIGAFGMGLTDLLVGISSQRTAPFFTMWFTVGLVSTLVFSIRFLKRREMKSVLVDFIRHPQLILLTSLIDNVAWCAYAVATTLIPISIAATISTSFMAISVLLGFFVNKEKIQRHQFVGIGISILSIVLLSALD